MQKTIKISDIIIKDRKRSASDTKYIQTLAKSIDVVGLIQNITLSKENILISGYHRIKALELLSIDEATVNILDLNKLQAELVEIDENIVRKNLNTLEFYEQINRKKEIYEELYPESTKAHKVGLNLQKKKSAIKTATEKDLHFTNNNTDLTDVEQQEVIESMPQTFVKDLSDATGTSERNVQIKVKIASSLQNVNKNLYNKLKDMNKLSDKILNGIVDLNEQSQVLLLKKISLIDEKIQPTPKHIKQFLHEIENESKIQRLKEEKANSKFKLTLNKCYLGKCENVLKNIDDDFFTSCITDVPYGLSYNNNVWDFDMPSQEAFDEVFRTLKSGAFFITTFSSRSDLVLELFKRVEKSGFDMTHSSLNWIYTSGMGRSAKIKEQIEKKDVDINSELFNDERGTHLKPSFEPIFIFQKPLLRSKNIDKNGKRVGTSINKLNNTLNSVAYNDTAKGTITDSFIDNDGNKKMSSNIISLDSGNERIDKFFSIKNWTEKLNISGSFLDIAKPSPKERLKDIKGNIISFDEGEEEKHDTVKPVALYLYLLKMFDNNNIPTVLEPFAGSGSTLISAELLDYNYVGVEMETKHYKIIKKRLLQKDDYIG